MKDIVCYFLSKIYRPIPGLVIIFVFCWTLLCDVGEGMEYALLFAGRFAKVEELWLDGE